MPTTPRTAKQVIDQAIRENRTGEKICYGLVLLFALAGLAVLGYGVWQGQGLIALAGSLAGAVLWPALRQARRIRKENQLLRLLEVPLTNAKTANEAAKVLSDTFKKLFSDDK
jgi:hypothetical protein